MLPGDIRRTTSELPDVGAKLEAWRLKMLYIFHFYHLIWFLDYYKILFVNI